MKANTKALFGNKFVNMFDGRLQLGHFDALKLARKHGTPTFVFLKEKIRKNIEKIKECFHDVFPNSYGYYSTKSNYLKGVIETVRDVDFGAEIVGLRELNILLSLNYPMEKVVAGGPYLPDSFLKAIIDNDVGFLIVYYLSDLPRIEKFIDKTVRKPLKIIVRIRNPSYSARHGINPTIENIKKLEKSFRQSSYLKYRGILMHFGTRLKSMKNYIQNFENIIQTVEKIEQNTDLRNEIINIGGGFPNADAVKKKNMKKYLQKAFSMLQEVNFGERTIFYEPGRYIISDAGFCLAKVHQIDRELNTIFLNIGNNFIPKFMKSSLRFYNLSRITESNNSPMDIMGYIPSDQDILVKNYNFTSNVEIGDYILIANVGAYALTWSTRFPYKFPNIVFLEESSDYVNFISNSEI